MVRGSGDRLLQLPETSPQAAVPAIKSKKTRHVALPEAMVQVCNDSRQIIAHDPQLRRLFHEFTKTWAFMASQPVDGHDQLSELYDEIDNLVCRIIHDSLRRQGLRWIRFDAHIVPPHSNENAHITLTVWPWMRRNDRQVRKHMEIQV